MQTFQIAGREDGLGLDKFAFGRQGVFFTVFDLDNGLPGTTVPPPPPYVPPGPPIATGQPKFLGGVWSPSQNPELHGYWNQVTPENAGKWGSVEGTRDVMNWARARCGLRAREEQRLPVPHAHADLGQPAAGVDRVAAAGGTAEEIEEWFAAVAARYPDIDFIDVVNEPLHDPPAGPANGNYIDALGGAGASGWDWVLQSFRLARQYFPNAKLGLNEFSVTNNTTDMQRYIDIIALLKAEGLIDTVGVQGHAFSTRVPSATTTANLDLLATTGLPIYVTELDIDGPTDESAARRLSAHLPGVLGASRRPGHHAVGLSPGPLAHRAGCVHRARQRRRAAGDGLAASTTCATPCCVHGSRASDAATDGHRRRQRGVHVRGRRHRTAGLSVAQGWRADRGEPDRPRPPRWPSPAS